MKKWVKFALFGGAALIGAAAAVAGAAYTATKLFVREALDREEPEPLAKAKDYLSEDDEPSPLQEAAAAAAERLRETELERVEITAADGVRLVGHLRRAERPERVILAMHGWRSSWYKDFGVSAGFFQEQNCTVLYAEQRGQGESGGNYMAFGLLERRDCLAWLRWLDRNVSPSLPVYLAGVSMGATTILLAAELPEVQRRVHGVLADCGFTSIEEIWRHVAEHQWRLPYGPVRPLVRRFCRERIHYTPDAASTVTAMERTVLPVLFVHGLEDDFVPPEMTEENYAACASPEKRILLVPGAGHGMSYLVDREGYESAVLDFWKTLEIDNTIEEDVKLNPHPSPRGGRR